MMQYTFWGRRTVDVYPVEGKDLVTIRPKEYLEAACFLVQLSLKPYTAKLLVKREGKEGKNYDLNIKSGREIQITLYQSVKH